MLKLYYHETIAEGLKQDIIRVSLTYIPNENIIQITGCHEHAPPLYII